MKKIDQLIAHFKTFDHYEPVEVVDTHIARLEALDGRPLDQDVTILLRSIGEVSLFDGALRLLPVEEMDNVGELQGAEYGRLASAPAWVALFDAWDGNYIALDLASSRILDCDNSNLGTARVIEANLTNFLERYLAMGPDYYWLEHDFKPSAVLIHEPGADFHRLANQEFWEKLGEETGTDDCTTTGCNHKRISYSVLCRRHHYKSIQGHTCPFDD